MPFDQELHKIFDARLAAFLPVNIAAYVGILERFLAAKIKAWKPVKFEEDMFSKLGRCVEERATTSSSSYSAPSTMTSSGISTMVVRDDSLQEKADGYIKVHEIDLSRGPNVVVGKLPSASPWCAGGRSSGKRRTRGGTTAASGRRSQEDDSPTSRRLHPDWPLRGSLLRASWVWAGGDEVGVRGGGEAHDLGACCA